MNSTTHDRLTYLENKVYEFNGLIERNRQERNEQAQILRDLITTNRQAIEALEILYQEQKRNHRELILYLKGVFDAMGYNKVKDALQTTLEQIPE